MITTNTIMYLMPIFMAYGGAARLMINCPLRFPKSGCLMRIEDWE